MNTTPIGWTDFSANPLKYRDAAGAVKWACAKVSPGCTNCYSEALAKRWNRGADYNAGEVAKLTPFLDAKEVRAMLTSQKISGNRVFVGDMTDIFGGWVADDLLEQLFAMFAFRYDVTWQVLTKRASRMAEFCYRFSGEWAIKDAGGQNIIGTGPLPNVWLGVSCEDQERADERIPHLSRTPAAIRFISAEPLLGPIDLSAHYGDIDWVIVGGESGPRFRSCAVEAITDIAELCRQRVLPVFVKQDANRLPGMQGRIPDSHFIHEFPQ